MIKLFSLLIEALVLGLRFMEAAKRSGNANLLKELKAGLDEIQKSENPEVRRLAAIRVSHLINRL